MPKSDQEIHDEILAEETMPPKRGNIRYRCTKCGEATSEINTEWLKWRRERAGLSLRGAARKWQLTPATLSLVEKGHNRCTLRILELYEELPA